MTTTSRKATLFVILIIILSASFAFRLLPFGIRDSRPNIHVHCTPEHHVCVMKTMFGLETPTAIRPIKTEDLPEKVKASVKNALSWLNTAQLADGGWGAGSHTRQDISDPHAVPSDPATTSIVCMALLRTGNSVNKGPYQKNMIMATDFLLTAVNNWKEQQPKLTLLESTQPQVKLGQNIDAILTVQYFSQLLQQLKKQQEEKWVSRIEPALNKCVQRIEREQDSDGGWKGGGWAPVLQSALADGALESAKEVGVKINDGVLERSKNYQKGNYDTATKSAITGKAAGVMLYAFSSTSRSSAKEARKAKDIIEKSKKEGRIAKDEELNEVTLRKAGLSPADAKKLTTAYLINENTKQQSVRSDVMQGFGSNGGEEMISYFMTGESILLQGNATEWKKWYDAMSQQIISIQQPGGNWQGHHCITSPVFCTAAALLILSINGEWSTAGTF